MEYYSVMKRNELLINTTSWMKLTVLCVVKEVRHKEVHTTWFYLLYSKTGKIICNYRCQDNC